MANRLGEPAPSSERRPVLVPLGLLGSSIVALYVAVSAVSVGVAVGEGKKFVLVAFFAVASAILAISAWKMWRQDPRWGRWAATGMLVHALTRLVLRSMS
jgi:hypothetical protein